MVPLFNPFGGRLLNLLNRALGSTVTLGTFSG